MAKQFFEDIGRESDEEIPSFWDFRRAMNTLTNKREKAIICLLYLGGYRCCEVVTRTTPYELEHQCSRPYGRVLTFEFVKYKIAGRTEQLLLIHSIVAKRLKKPKDDSKKPKAKWKTISLPCGTSIYEPWTLEILQFAQSQRKKHRKDPDYKDEHGLRLNMTRMTIQNIVKRNLRIFFPEIHPHSLRHYRCSHLLKSYGFDPYELAAYFGWSLKTSFAGTGMPVSSMIERYAGLGCKTYIDKLLVPISTIQ